MNTQFVTGAYAMLTYLAFYLCKPEHTMSELMIKASKKLMIKILEEKCIWLVTYLSLTKRKISTHEAHKRVLSLPLEIQI